MKATQSLRYGMLTAFVMVGGIAFVLSSRPATEPPPTTSRVALRPVLPAPIEGAPKEVQEFLDRVFEQVPDGGSGATGYRFQNWKQEGKPTDEAIGLKAVVGVTPDELIARVMDVQGYKANVAHVEECRSVSDPAFQPPRKARFFQIISVPGIAKVQQELVLVDAGTVKGYRIAYWYLLKDKTQSLDTKVAARSEFNIGAWLAAPGVVGYALSSWPVRADVNRLQWLSLTSGANALAKKVIEGNIDGLVEWAKKARKTGLTSR